MSNRKTRVTYGGINQDLAKSRVQDNMYYDANNIKLTPVEGQSFGTVSNAYGNILSATLPQPVINTGYSKIIYGNKELPYLNNEINSLPQVSGKQEIIGHIETIRGAILFSTDGILDCIWEVVDLDEDILDVNLLYMRKMGFSKSTPIQAIYNYENELIQKVYWVDGTNYLRFINIKQSIANGFDQNLIDLPVTSVNSKSTVDISKPLVESGGGGGVHTAGMIQYGYTLYNLNGAETSLSPISDLFALDKGPGNGGGAVNEVVGAMPVVVINNVDTKYTYIKLYSVKYTEYNGTPSINLIYDGNIGNYTRFTFNDTGTTSLGAIDLASFLFLGADPIKPSHIVAKDNILFASNNKSTAYKLDVDMRAYSFNQAGTSAKIYTDVVYDITKGEIPYTGTLWDVAVKGYDVPATFDAVNLDFDTYRYTDNGISGTPGRTIVNNASAVAQINALAPIDIFSNGAGTVTVAMSSICDPTNTLPKTYSLTLVPIVGTNNRIVAQSDGIMEVRFRGGVTATDVTNRMVVSSVIPELNLYASATGALLNTVKMTVQPASTGDDAYIAYVPVTAGQAVGTDVKVSSHFTNNTCPYQSTDVNSIEAYEGDGPYIGPDETGNSISVNATLTYSEFTAKLVDDLSRVTDMPLVPTSGETNILNGKYVADYTGSIDAAITLTVNMNGDALQYEASQYSIAMYRNGLIVNSAPLLLTSAGLNITNYTPRFNVVYGDLITLEIVNNRAGYNGTLAVPPAALEAMNITASATVTFKEGTSSGGNGEGGTGKFVKYILERTDEANLSISATQGRFFKDNEIYRIGVVFWNSIGQASEVKWIADFKAPEGNLEGQFNTLRVEFTNAFYAYINGLSEELKPTNYSIVRAVRSSTDKTIVSQGILTGMFVQDYSSNSGASASYAQKSQKNPGLVKTPIPITRGYGNGKGLTNSYYPVFPTGHNKTMTNSKVELDPARNPDDQDPRSSTPKDIIVDEIYRDARDEYQRQQSWQYTKMLQMYSPEATFGFQINPTDTDELYLLGYMPRNEYNVWDFNINTETFGPQLSSRKDFLNGTAANFYPYLVGGFGVIGPPYRRWESGHSRGEYSDYNTDAPPKHARRTHFRKTFLPLERVSSEKKYSILNKPEVTEVGQGITSYNSDRALQYTNKLSLVVSDAKRPTSSNGTDLDPIRSVQSEGNRCLTMVLGDNGIDHETRPGLDDLYTAAGTGEWDVELFGEIRKTKSYVYSGALYGGYDISSRSRTEYVSIGEAYDISNAIAVVESPGDTYVQVFKNTRLTKIPGTVYTKDVQVIVETLEYLVETTINLVERNDSSISSWDAVVDPTSEEGTSYNRVYSTDATIQTFTTDSLKLRNIERKEVEIIASKVKIPGEFVDNWVDFRPNEVMYLDGKYGPVNNVVNHWDQLFAFQDFAVAKLAVNPRVQIQDSDSVSIQLGTGQVLHDYQYLTTKSGCINKWAITSTNSGLYYLDANLKQLQRLQPEKGIEGVSEAKGLHGFLQKMLDRDVLRTDNPVTQQGAVIGYDIVNGDVFTTVIKNGESFTLSFNEKMNAFTSFYSFIPTRYIVKGERVVTVPSNNNTLWSHTKGAPYQTWYGTKHESDITILINTDVPGMEKVFNNIEFDSEVTLDGVDVYNSTITSIEAWTTYQESGKIPLVVGRDIIRKFRTWRTFIPREKNSRNRLRDKWLFLKVGYDSQNNNKLILHDIIINYSG